jgi:hypothetical protein
VDGLAKVAFKNQTGYSPTTMTSTLSPEAKYFFETRCELLIHGTTMTANRYIVDELLWHARDLKRRPHDTRVIEIYMAAASDGCDEVLGAAQDWYAATTQDVDNTTFVPVVDKLDLKMVLSMVAVQIEEGIEEARNNLMGRLDHYLGACLAGGVPDSDHLRHINTISQVSQIDVVDAIRRVVNWDQRLDGTTRFGGSYSLDRGLEGEEEEEESITEESEEESNDESD